MDGFGYVGNCEALGSFQVGDGAGYFEDAVVGSGGEALLEHGSLEEFFGVGGELAVSADLAGSHLRVVEDFFPDSDGGG